jgi:hypothetical protein
MIIGVVFVMSLLCMLQPKIEDLLVGTIGIFLSSAAFLGNTVLHFSPRYFVLKTTTQTANSVETVLDPSDFNVSISSAIITFLLFCCGEVYNARPSKMPHYICAVACMVMLFSAAYTHGVTSRPIRGYALVQPLVGGRKFVMLQAEAWMMIGFVINFSFVGAVSAIVSTDNSTVAENAYFPGMLVVYGLGALTANVLLIVSLRLFESHSPLSASSQSSARIPTSRLARTAWIGGIALMVVPPALGFVQYLLGLQGLTGSDQEKLPLVFNLSPRALLLIMFASAPISHMSASLESDSGSLFMEPFSGGFRFMAAQSFGWLLYGIALCALMVSALNDIKLQWLTQSIPWGTNERCNATNINTINEHGAYHGAHDPMERSEVQQLQMLPLVFFAQACISVSIMYFRQSDADGESGAPKVSRGCGAPNASVSRTRDKSNERGAVARGAASTKLAQYEYPQVLLMSTLKVVIIGTVSAVGIAVGAVHLRDDLGWREEELGWSLFFLVCVVTLGGFHMVWTHAWLVASAALVLTGSKFALATCACLGINISVTWYTMLIFRREATVVARAVAGWGRWVCNDLCGTEGDGWKGNISFHIIGPIDTLFLGFHLTDLGVHLVPTLILLQLGAAHIDSSSVVVAYAATRLWSVAITLHHFVIDWEHFRRSSYLQLRVLRKPSQKVTAWVDREVINLVYGFEPHVPVDFFQFATKIELMTALSCLLVTVLPIDTKDRVAIFRTMGGAHFLTVPTLTESAGYCVVAGAVLIVGGAFLAFKTQRGSSSGFIA